MPNLKPSKTGNTLDSNSGPEDRGPVKTLNVSCEENSWDLGRNRFAKLVEFKGKWYVDIREFYEAGRELRPGKRGIMLTIEQWQKFKSFMDDIDAAVQKNVKNFTT